MSSNFVSSQAQWNLRVAQKGLLISAFDRLWGEPCVSFALACGELVDFSPTVDIAVRLLSIATLGGSVDDGRKIHATPGTLDYRSSN